MTKVSRWRKMGIATRLARNQVGRSRTYNAVAGAARATARSFGKAFHQLWLEVTGTVFLSMAAFGAFALAREYMKYTAGRSSAGHVAIAVGFTLVFGWFGLSSFLRVRRKSQRS